MAVAIDSHTQTLSTGYVTSGSIAKPAGTASGDLLVFHLSIGWKDATAFVMSGFTLINASYSAANPSDIWAYKVAGGSEPSSYSFSWTTSDAFIADMFRISGANATSPVNAFGVSQSTSTSPTSPSVTTTVNNCLLLLGLGTGYAGDHVTSVPPGATQQSTGQSSGTLSNVACATIASTTAPTAGATGTFGWTYTAGGLPSSQASTLAIAPGGGGPVSQTVSIGATGAVGLLRRSVKVVGIGATGAVGLLRGIGREIAIAATGAVGLKKSAGKKIVIVSSATVGVKNKNLFARIVAIDATGRVGVVKRVGKVVRIAGNGATGVAKRVGKIVGIGTTGLVQVGKAFGKEISIRSTGGVGVAKIIGVAKAIGASAAVQVIAAHSTTFFQTVDIGALATVVVRAVKHTGGSGVAKDGFYLSLKRYLGLH